MSAEMNCSAGSPTQFGQIDMPSSYLAGASAKSPHREVPWSFREL